VAALRLDDGAVEIECAGLKQGEGGLLGCAGLPKFAFQACRLFVERANAAVHSRATQQHGDSREKAPADNESRSASDHRLAPG